MIDRGLIHDGMVVRSVDGRKLGRVMLCEEEKFVIQRHAFSNVEYVAGYDDVADVSGGEVLLARTGEELVHFDRKDEHAGAEPASYGDEGGAGRVP